MALGQLHYSSPEGYAGAKLFSNEAKKEQIKEKQSGHFTRPGGFSVNKSNTRLGSAAVVVSPGILSWTWDM